MPGTFFNKSYPFTENVRKIITGNLVIGLFVAFFLVVFQPFEINLWQTNFKLLKLAGFGIVSFVVPTFISTVTYLFFSPRTREERWTIGKEIISIIIVLSGIAVGNLLYGNWLGIMPFSFEGYLTVLFFTCVIGIFPVTLHVMRKHNRYLRENLEKTRAINEEIATHKMNSPEKETTLPHPPEIILTAENGKDVYKLDPDSLLYIESSDNYSSVYYCLNNEQKKLLIRSSLKRIESQMNDQRIVRCHRTFIVNLTKITNVQGNAAGYKLSLLGCETLIPVSRSYIPVINRIIKQT